MSFQEKIDKILKANKLHINSVYGLELFVKASVGSISKPIAKGIEPGLGTIKKIREGLPGLNQDWWDTGKGEVFIENSTYVETPIKKDPSEEVRILARNIDRMGAMNEYLLEEIKKYRDRFGDL